MRYQSPKLIDLIEFSKQLCELYKNNNPKRREYIALLNQVTTCDDPHIILSCLVSGMVWIENEFEYKHCYLSPERSSLYRLIKGKLNITVQNPLHDDDKLILLLDFYHFIKSNADKVIDDFLTWKNKEGLLQAIKNNLEAVLNHQAENIQYLLKEPPDFWKLENNIKQLLLHYQESIAMRWFSNPKRDALIKFIRFQNETCQQFYLTNNANNMGEVPADILSLQMELVRNIRLGTILFVLSEIQNEYYFTSPKQNVLSKGSELFNDCLTVMNVKSLNEVTSQNKTTCLRAVLMHIKYMKDHHATLIDDWKRMGLDVSVYENKIENQLANEEKNKIKPAIGKECLTKLASYAVKYGIGFMTSQMLLDCAMPSMGGVLVAGLTGPMGYAVYGATGAIIATQLGQLVRDKVLPTALANLYARVLEKIGEIIGHTTANGIILSFSVSAQGLRSLLGFYNRIQLDHQDLLSNKAWIETLLNLPDDIFPQEKKSIILNTRDLYPHTYLMHSR